MKTKNKNHFTILMGESASGKTSIADELVKNYGYKKYLTCTTRPRREGESRKAYRFWTREKFVEELKNFIEVKTYRTVLHDIEDTWYYGTPILKKHFWDCFTKPKNYVIVLTLSGAKKFVEYYGKENCSVFYISVPTATRYIRAKNRGEFCESEWQRRFKADIVDFPEKEVKELADKVVKNTSSNINSAIMQILGYNNGRKN